MFLPGMVKGKGRFPTPGESPTTILKIVQATQSYYNSVVTKHSVNSKQFHSPKLPESQ